VVPLVCQEPLACLGHRGGVEQVAGGDGAYARRYGVDRYTAYDDLAALGFVLPTSAQQWAQRPPATARRTAARRTDRVEHDPWIVLDGRLFFVVSYTSGGAPYGMFEDEMEPYDDPP